MLLTTSVTLSLLSLPQARHRIAEYAVGVFLLVIAGCFAYELSLAHLDLGDLARGFLPRAEILTNRDMLYLSIGIIGATIMPHNLYLHSGLVRRRAAELRQWAPTEALRFLSLDS